MSKVVVGIASRLVEFGIFVIAAIGLVMLLMSMK